VITSKDFFDFENIFSEYLIEVRKESFRHTTNPSVLDDLYGPWMIQS
jgi:hypothetical protein